MEPTPELDAPASQTLSPSAVWTPFRTCALLLAFFFFLAYLPTLPSLSRWRGDEKFYTDAAVAMHNSGDYLTPASDDGALRFKKPILTYWAVLAGYKAFGFNYFASRILFLIAGSTVIWLTFELCLALARRPDLALVATAIMASNLTVQHTSIRSTPDILLCLFITTSLLGFVGLLFHERRVRWHLLAYGGVALAVGTKGLSGLLPVLYAVLFCLVIKPAGKRVRDLFHPLITPAAVVLAGAWYAWAFFEHGQSAAADFFGDQVGNRLSGGKIYIISNALVYLSSFVVQLLPWSLLAVLSYAADRRAVNMAVSNQKRVLQFATGWTLLLFLVFVWGNIQRTRYFLPAYPMLALVFALALLPDEGSLKTRRICEGALQWFLWVASFAGLAVAVFGFMLSPVLVLSGAVLAVAGWIALWLARGLPLPQRFALAAGYVLLWFSVNLNFIAPTFLFSPTPEITRRATDLLPSLGHSRLPMTGMDSAYPSQVRALSAGKVQAYVVPADEAEQALKENGVLVCTEPVLARWKPERATVEACVVGSIPWKARDFVALLRTNDRPAFLSSKRLKCYLVTRPEHAASGVPAPRRTDAAGE